MPKTLPESPVPRLFVKHDLIQLETESIEQKIEHAIRDKNKTMIEQKWYWSQTSSWAQATANACRVSLNKACIIRSIRVIGAENRGRMLKNFKTSSAANQMSSNSLKDKQVLLGIQIN